MGSSGQGVELDVIGRYRAPNLSTTQMRGDFARTLPTAYLPEVPAKNTDYHRISDGDWRRTRLGGVHRCIGPRRFDDSVTGAK